jgi:hypothetical protein
MQHCGRNGVVDTARRCFIGCAIERSKGARSDLGARNADRCELGMHEATEFDVVEADRLGRGNLTER